MESSRPISKTRGDLEGMVAYWEQAAADSIRREAELKGKFMQSTAMLIDATAKLNVIHKIAKDHASCQVNCDALLDIVEVLGDE